MIYRVTVSQLTKDNPSRWWSMTGHNRNKHQSSRRTNDRSARHSHVSKTPASEDFLEDELPFAIDSAVSGARVGQSKVFAREKNAKDHNPINISLDDQCLAIYKVSVVSSSKLLLIR